MKNLFSKIEFKNEITCKVYDNAEFLIGKRIELYIVQAIPTRALPFTIRESIHLKIINEGL